MHYNGTLPAEETGFSSAQFEGQRADLSVGPGATPYVVQSITPALLHTQEGARARQAVAKPNPVLQQDIAHYSYAVKPGDVVSIVVWGDPTQVSAFQSSANGSTGAAAPTGAPSSSNGASANVSGSVGFRVAGDGSVFFPYVGHVPVAGKTIDAIRDQFTALLRPYLKKPQVTVDIALFNSQKYELSGAVLRPGLYSITDQPVTVSQAIAAAGGVIQQIPNAAATGVTIPRPLGDLSHVQFIHAGSAETLNLRDFYRYGDISQDRLVHQGDAIQVPDNSFEQVHVIGEVRLPGNYPLDNGKLNLAQILGDAGGLNLSFADPARIFVFRGAYQKPEIFWLDARSADAMLLAKDFELRPQDVVYAATSGLTNWDRIVQQILPTVQSIYETKVLVSP